MSWYSLWAEKPSPSKRIQRPRSYLNEAAELEPQPSSEPPRSTSSEVPTPPRQLSRDEVAEQELNHLLEEFKRDAERYETGQTRDVDAQPRISDLLPAGNIHPANLPDTRLSCRDRFDYAFACQNFGGQFLHAYRFASLPRNCNDLWNEFWFCMRNKGRGEEVKDRVYLERKLRKDEERYGEGKPSSEDVWTMRVMPVVDAFKDDYEADFAAAVKMWKEGSTETPSEGR